MVLVVVVVAVVVVVVAVVVGGVVGNCNSRVVNCDFSCNHRGG